jgi:hypothetical protein
MIKDIFNAFNVFKLCSHASQMSHMTVFYILL